MSDMNALQAYLSERNIQDADFAKRIGLSRVSVSRLRRDKQNFTLNIIQRIAKATNNDLTPNDFINAAIVKKPRRKKIGNVELHKESPQ